MRRSEADVHPKLREVSLNPTRLSRVTAWVTVAALFALPPIAHATHYLVDSGGGGDYSTIQPAINAAQVAPRDSIIVQPGAYPDTLTFGSGISTLVIQSTAGAAATSARAVRMQGGAPRRIVGLTFIDGGSYSGTDYWSCTFLGAIAMSPGGLSTSMHDCDFYGSAQFFTGGIANGSYAGIERCHFHSAPCQSGAGGSGPLQLIGCTFEGPGDPLLIGGGDSFDPLFISGCTFSNARNGANCTAMTFYDHCVARDITGDAIAASCPGCDHGTSRRIEVNGCRFERCGTAIRVGDNGSSRVALSADTVLACTHDAIVLTQAEGPSDGATIQGVIVDGAGGNGMDVRLVYTWPAVWIQDCRIQNTSGFGLRVMDDPTINYHSRHTFIRNVQVDHNGGPGIVVAASNVAMTGNVVWANGGNGIDLTTQWTDSAPSDSITGNTAYGNTGVGIRAAVIGALTGVDQVIQYNLAVSNTGPGLVMANAYRGSVAFNDAWSNSGGAYNGVASPADSNLTSDPQLCNASAGDFGLHASSPAGPSGAYGLIGAKPEGCNVLASVAPPVASLAFSAYPNPARGSIVFAAPASSAGRVDVVDVLGRRVWSSTLRAGESVRWDGRGESGPTRPGVYLARFSGAGTVRTLRLVWIE
jgi:hypothetical protein